MYSIKTRNWNNSTFAAFIFARLPLNTDGERYFLSTPSVIRAWFVFACCMALRPLSGGWTYIVRPGHEVGEGYKSIY